MSREGEREGERESVREASDHTQTSKFNARHRHLQSSHRHPTLFFPIIILWVRHLAQNPPNHGQLVQQRANRFPRRRQRLGRFGRYSDIRPGRVRFAAANPAPAARKLYTRKPPSCVHSPPEQHACTIRQRSHATSPADPASTSKRVEDNQCRHLAHLRTYRAAKSSSAAQLSSDIMSNCQHQHIFSLVQCSPQLLHTVACRLFVSTRRPSPSDPFSKVLRSILIPHHHDRRNRHWIFCIITFDSIAASTVQTLLITDFRPFSS